MRPHTQLSFELCVWAEGDQCCPTTDTLMLLFVDFLRLGMTDSFRNEKYKPSGFSGNPQIYLLKVLLCVSETCLVSLWNQANSFTEHAPEPSQQPYWACSRDKPTALLSMLLSQALQDLTFATCPVTPHPAPAHAFVHIFLACSQTRMSYCLDESLLSWFRG